MSAYESVLKNAHRFLQNIPHFILYCQAVLTGKFQETGSKEYNEKNHDTFYRKTRSNMSSKASSLGRLIADLMAKHNYTNRSLAAAAGVSESAIRNLLKVGVEQKAKDPDARTLSLVAKALDVDSLRLFRLVGYISPEPAAHSIRADYLAELFDELPAEKQDAVLNILEAMTDNREGRQNIQKMRNDPSNPLAGIDLAMPGTIRLFANQLIAQLELAEPHEVNRIKPDTQIMQYKWADLPQSTQERIKALIRHKLSLDYDPTMVDPEWRK